MTTQGLSLPVPVTFFFGRRPYYVREPAREVQRPIGTDCMLCQTPIGEHGSGTLEPVAVYEPENAEREDGLVGRQLPAHAECKLRCALGGIGHVLEKCSCYGGTLDNDLGLSYRESSLLVWAWVQVQGSANRH